MLDRITEIATAFFQEAVAFLGQTEIWVQLVVIAGLFLPAWYLSHKVEPALEERARRIKRMPGLLRLVIAFLQRFECC